MGIKDDIRNALTEGGPQEWDSMWSRDGYPRSSAASHVEQRIARIVGDGEILYGIGLQTQSGDVVTVEATLFSRRFIIHDVGGGGPRPDAEGGATVISWNALKSVTLHSAYEVDGVWNGLSFTLSFAPPIGDIRIAPPSREASDRVAKLLDHALSVLGPVPAA